MSVHRILKSNTITNSIPTHIHSQSNSTNQNSVYSNNASSSLKTNSNIRFVSSKDHYDATQDHHKPKKKINKFVHTFLIKIF